MEKFRVEKRNEGWIIYEDDLEIARAFINASSGVLTIGMTRPFRYYSFEEIEEMEDSIKRFQSRPTPTPTPSDPSIIEIIRYIRKQLDNLQEELHNLRRDFSHHESDGSNLRIEE